MKNLEQELKKHQMRLGLVEMQQSRQASREWKSRQVKTESQMILGSTGQKVHLALLELTGQKVHLMLLD